MSRPWKRRCAGCGGLMCRSDAGLLCHFCLEAAPGMKKCNGPGCKAMLRPWNRSGYCRRHQSLAAYSLRNQERWKARRRERNALLRELQAEAAGYPEVSA